MEQRQNASLDKLPPSETFYHSDFWHETFGNRHKKPNKKKELADYLFDDFRKRVEEANEELLRKQEEQQKALLRTQEGLKTAWQNLQEEDNELDLQIYKEGEKRNLKINRLAEEVAENIDELVQEYELRLEEKKKLKIQHKLKNREVKRVNKKKCVYVISNPAWPEWVKVGSSTTLPEDETSNLRLSQFNTGSPFKDYKLEYQVLCEDAPTLEKRVHRNLSGLFDYGVSEKRAEWFKCGVKDAILAIEIELRLLKG